MIAEFHFLRPWWLLMLVPLLGLMVLLWRASFATGLSAWSEVCDSHLLKYIIHHPRENRRKMKMSFLLLSMFCMIFSIAGPSWYKLPAPVYKTIHPRVLLLDMSTNMMATDLTPNRLSRAKFKVQDLFTHTHTGQFGLIVFTSEPFVVSPLTDDAQTISALLSTLTPDIMPVAGQNLSIALQEASKLIQQAGYQQGQILVLTADSPSTLSIEMVRKIAQQGIFTSIIPVTADKNLDPLFQKFAQAGKGQLIPYSPDSKDLALWVDKEIKNTNFSLSTEDDIPLWRDEGRWFLLLALLFLVPIFKKGWLQRTVI